MASVALSGPPGQTKADRAVETERLRHHGRELRRNGEPEQETGDDACAILDGAHRIRSVEIIRRPEFDLKLMHLPSPDRLLQRAGVRGSTGGAPQGMELDGDIGDFDGSRLTCVDGGDRRYAGHPYCLCAVACLVGHVVLVPARRVRPDRGV